MDNFLALGLAAPLVSALTKIGYAKPTPIQARAIPALLAGRDLIGVAQTGTGKTAAFALPILHGLLANPRRAAPGSARVLILSPTRELASQIAQSFRDLSHGLSLSIAVVFGGVPHGAQIKALARGLDVLVATPGRLVDHLDAKVANLRGVEYFVLDEVDQMLDLGFIKPIRRVIRDLPPKRQNLFFSATMPSDIRRLAGELLRDPVEVAVTPAAKTADRVEQRVILVDEPRKRDMLVELFKDQAMSRAIVFTRTKRGADRVAKALDEAGVDALAIHGNKSQGQRERALAAFRGGAARALVATDIAARGIDIDGVTHVVNFELPEVAEAYVHRIGRTARAGREGVAISLCAPADRDLLRGIEKLTRLAIPSVDRRGHKGPAPSPVVRKAAPPTPHRPDRAPQRDARSRKQGAPMRASRPARRPWWAELQARAVPAV
ncbi:MAG TPA: DEAD/DEAH box helicase [Roseiarcus sp.]|nr:DEAD/DEAH box helicase [Roseiarcus sp.]